MIRHPLAQLALYGALTALALGCLGRSPSVRYYALSPAVRTAPATSDLAVGLGPITFPLYLDRPQIVTRANGSEVHLDDLNRWAGGLLGHTETALASHLAASLETERVFLDPGHSPDPIAYQVSVDFRRFEGQRNGTLVLHTRWIVHERSGERRVLSNDSAIEHEVDGRSIQALVSAHDEALARLADEIAAAIHGIR